MRTDPDKSRYHEHPSAARDFNRAERSKAQYLLRRLRYLEAKIEETGGMADTNGSGGGVHAELELQALEWVLDEVGFLETREPKVKTT